MMHDLPTFAQLLKQLQQVPYLASKNLFRVAWHFVAMDDAALEKFCHTLLLAKQKLEQCSICFVWKEKENKCSFCSNGRRDQSIICVVEQWQEMYTIEKTGGYNGVYHILGGAISPLEGIGPEELMIEQLIARCQQEVQELILATNQTPEGEATAAYIASKVKGLPIKISCLARGVPVGSSLEFMDRLTVYKALAERRPF